MATRPAVYEGGDPNGVAVFYQHGTPSSGLLYAAHDRSARKRGIRLIGYDRPGYGDSPRSAGRSVADAGRALDDLADALGLDRFGTWGLSGGGPHALAAAARCSERLVAVVTLASPAPFAAEGLNWSEGMGEDNLTEFAAAGEGEDALRAYLEPVREHLLRIDPSEMRAALESLLGDADRAVLDGALADWVTGADKNGLRNTLDGWLDDDLAFVVPWGFDLAAIDRPVLLMHGRDDRFVPASHGEWLADRIPGVDARITDDDGHLTLVERRIDDTHDWLRAHLA